MICSDAPAYHAANILCTEMSKLEAAVAATLSCGESGYISFIVRKKCSRAPHEITTPLGTPVLPEVNMM